MLYNHVYYYFYKLKTIESGFHWFKVNHLGWFVNNHSNVARIDFLLISYIG